MNINEFNQFSVNLKEKKKDRKNRKLIKKDTYTDHPMTDKISSVEVSPSPNDYKNEINNL